MNTRTRFDVAFTRKNPDLALTTNDINYKRTFFYEKPDFTLKLDDIEGARPKRRTSHMGKRCVNPLNPEYKLPSFKQVDPLVPQFRRCNIDIADIEKTQSKPLPKKIREINYGEKVIERSRRKSYQRTNVFLDSLDVSDINNYHIGYNAFRSKRLGKTDPNQPVYNWNNRTSSQVKGSTSRVLIRSLNKKDTSLCTQDIKGAEVVHDRWRRTYLRNFETLDIDGAQASTSVRGFKKSRRVTNPLNPRYKLLDTPPGTPEKH